MADRLIKSPRYPRTLLFWPAKTPDEAADYGFDWTDVLLSPVELAALAAGGKVQAPADGIDTSDYVLPAGIVASASSNTAVLTSVTLTGGDAGQVYSITNRIVTKGKRTFERVVKLRVRAG